ncbi:hypothetical protein [Mycobacteroides abscessus]|uniref:hypothetical protein n=1 Tax=Mycobacteroides abscessus TaxID=36809 RepID=UPI00092741EA|nr:hypothetical protein [Mycobacteroides abscessus]MBE5502402.1 hypothetical protein [Mycobacteroides abscessus]MDO2986846.1 hypothetical protein [Mycobacteroides abscessus subsp. abscessus]MDO3208876.1 hypothetical protein [Mycobacteroides abscessus subsp. massiliense]RIS64328.1 hypothetical protein D2E70_26030 [Mycobacteroides abscessus]SIA27483.1 Uncharacterised protein [Mycobacteroides abscessus subsp. abscessus]
MPTQPGNPSDQIDDDIETVKKFRRAVVTTAQDLIDDETSYPAQARMVTLLLHDAKPAVEAKRRLRQASA